jgi:hypothetical protein
MRLASRSWLALLVVAFGLVVFPGSDCGDEEPSGPDPDEERSGTYARTSTRTLATGSCPQPIASPAPVIVESEDGFVSISLPIGNGFAGGELDSENDVTAVGEATLPNGFRVQTTYDLTYGFTTQGVPRFQGTMTILHFSPAGQLVCTEVYDVVMVQEG